MRPFGDVAGAASAMLGFSQMGIAALANAGVSLLPMGPVFAIPVMFAILAVLGLMVYGSTFALHPERGSAEMVESGE
jgi:DHA1 family bicyclomycin/chloramphenicol resistance-like MFS transporter